MQKAALMIRPLRLREGCSFVGSPSALKFGFGTTLRRRSSSSRVRAPAAATVGERGLVGRAPEADLLSGRGPSM